MQASYHQQLAGMNEQPASVAPNLLITSQQMNTLQQQSAAQSALSESYRHLVKPYLLNMDLCNNGLNGSGDQGARYQQQSSPMSTSTASATPTNQQHHQHSVASFAAKLMSLDAHEIQCLDTDQEIVTHIIKIQSLVESRLQNIHFAKTTSSLTNQHHNNTDENQRKPYNHQHQQPLNLNALALQNQRQHEMQLQQQQQHLLLSQQNDYYNSLYAKQLALNQYVQLQHEQQQAQQQAQHRQQQQLMLMASRIYNSNSSSCASLDSRSNQLDASTNKNSCQYAATNNHLSNTTITTTTAATATPLTSNRVNYQNNTAANPHQTAINSSGAPALDLRTTPTRPMSASTSPIGTRCDGSSSNNAATRLLAPLPPKKMQSSEYKKLQQLAEQDQSVPSNPLLPSEQLNNNLTSRQYARDHVSDPNSCETMIEDQNRNPSFSGGDKDKQLSSPGEGVGGLKRLHQEIDNSLRPPSTVANSNTRTSIRQQQHVTKSGGTLNAATGKKYKGEFDEPTPSEVAARELQLHKLGHYHEQAVSSGSCACVIGSEFRDKTKREAIEQLEHWRQMDIAERIKWKWDVGDLPEDIHLSEIKKYEDLRRDYSNGRADFGGASKRKPLSIRGTRQFLLMLYCLWGHPGREDPMQKEGYCPHCFAKIRTDNEQSTLVRVVNHFNMKHKRGANPRLSPHVESRSSPHLLMSPSPQSQHQVVDTLISVVETAVAAVEGEQGKGEQKPELQVEQQQPASVVTSGATPSAAAATEKSVPDDGLPKQVKNESTAIAANTATTTTTAPAVATKASDSSSEADQAANDSGAPAAEASNALGGNQ